jgi:(4S)-4-hydroxy-5-phosphonooxypentane-2,3-dione isomerase
MTTTCVYVTVKPEHIDDFIKAMLANHTESVKEPGNLRFDVLQDSNDPCKFMIYEVYETEEAAAAHKSTAHYALWRDTVANWMAEPRKGVKYAILAQANRKG